MKRRRSVPLELLLLLSASGAGCITINVYFPVAELEEAAEAIVKDVRSVEGEGDGAPQGNEGASADPEKAPTAGEPASPAEASGPGEEEAQRELSLPGRTGRGLFALFEVPAARAAARAPEEGKGAAGDGQKGKIKIDISTPVIKGIRETLKKRHPRLVPFFEKGALGEGWDGHVALRLTEGLSLKEKRDLQALLKEENDDRKNLYTEIARENEIEATRAADIGALFAVEWQETSKTGWWIEKEKGKWIKKPEDKDKKKKAAPKS
jgi:uncharacterized protein YdbL (DUF1318 family)